MVNPMTVQRHDPDSPAEWRDHITRYGYVIVHNVLPQQFLDATIDDIWSHTGADPLDSETWYRPDIIRPVGMVEMYHYQSMWNNRQHSFPRRPPACWAYSAANYRLTTGTSQLQPKRSACAEDAAQHVRGGRGGKEPRFAG